MAGEFDTCEWCGATYPKGCEYFWRLELFGEQKHIICHDCYKHLDIRMVW